MVTKEKGHLDLPKAVEGGFAGGLFAVFVPSNKAGSTASGVPSPDVATDVSMAPAVDLVTARTSVMLPSGGGSLLSTAVGSERFRQAVAEEQRDDVASWRWFKART
jgi:hypothetical protein